MSDLDAGIDAVIDPVRARALGTIVSLMLGSSTRGLLAGIGRTLHQ